MNRKRRTEILIRSPKELAKKLADNVRKKYAIRVIEEPNQGLVMIKMRETAKKELFYLGEVLVSEAKVYVNGALGMGIVKGENEELALNLAIIDGAYKAGASWIIPDDSEKPNDARIKSGKYIKKDGKD